MEAELSLMHLGEAVQLEGDFNHQPKESKGEKSSKTTDM
jgi:hypothetical protein